MPYELSKVILSFESFKNEHEVEEKKTPYEPVFYGVLTNCIITSDLKLFLVRI